MNSVEHRDIESVILQRALKFIAHKVGIFQSIKTVTNLRYSSLTVRFPGLNLADTVRGPSDKSVQDFSRLTESKEMGNGIVKKTKNINETLIGRCRCKGQVDGI